MTDLPEAYHPPLTRDPGFAWVRNAARAFAKYRRDQRDYRALMEMSDHALRDIGLTRGDVQKAADRRMEWPRI